MGCFSIFPCFSTSKNRKVKNTRNSATPSPSNQGRGHCEDVLLVNPKEESTNLDSPRKHVSDSRDNSEDQLVCRSEKKEDTFDVNVKTFADVSFEEVKNRSVDSKEEEEEEKGKEEESGKLGVLVKIEIEEDREKEMKEEDGKSEVFVAIENEKEREGEVKEERNRNQVQSPDFSDSSVSSYISYPPMHRYHNCSPSDDEDNVFIEEESSESLFSLPVGSRRQSKSYRAEADDKEVSSPLKIHGLPELKRRSIGFDPNGGNQSQDINSVLNPIENLSPRKTLKAVTVPTLEQHEEKENIKLEQVELDIPFSEEPNLKKLGRKEKIDNDNVVTASLSSWLVESEKTTPISNEGSQSSIGYSYSYSDGANSWKSFEDRPILGALTIEEVRQISANSSPRKSPRRNPDEMPIIGTVGSYWRHTGQATDSSNSCSSTRVRSGKSSRHREDKIPSCHSTPLRTRFERALDRGNA